MLATHAALADPRYEAYHSGVYLRFLNTPEGNVARTAPPTLGLSFGGPSVRAVMDTGSTGIVVSATSIPGVERLPQLGPGTLSYSSSGRIMRGHWVMTAATISGANGAHVTTQPMPVLAIDRIDCFSNARDCEPTDDPRHVAMVGIGFARESDHQAQSTPDKNPFLNLPGMGTMGQPGLARRGYVVTREGVHVGLTVANTRGSYRFIKLDKAPDGRDWKPLPACITVARTQPACGTALVDTGVTAMYLTVPPDRAATRTEAGATGSRTLVAGTPVGIRFGPDDGPQSPRYGFTAQDRNDPVAPSRIVLVEGHDRPTFVNTSVHVLNAFDYLFDADGGYVAFRRLPPGASQGGIAQ
ncbi:hypothetical protein BOFL111202_09405 [Bordetella flabilis]